MKNALKRATLYFPVPVLFILNLNEFFRISTAKRDALRRDTPLVLITTYRKILWSFINSFTDVMYCLHGLIICFHYNELKNLRHLYSAKLLLPIRKITYATLLPLILAHTTFQIKPHRPLGAHRQRIRFVFFQVLFDELMKISSLLLVTEVTRKL